MAEIIDFEKIKDLDTINKMCNQCEKMQQNLNDIISYNLDDGLNDSCNKMLDGIIELYQNLSSARSKLMFELGKEVQDE